MTSPQAYAAVSHAFPKVADFQGPHFRYAEKNGVVMLEIKKYIPIGDDSGQREPRYFYWLMVDGQFEMIHDSPKSKFGSMKTIGETIPAPNSPTTRR